LGCSECFNLHTWSTAEKVIFDVGTLVSAIVRRDDSGLTLSGGEPFDQYEQMITLLTGVRKADPERSIIIFTGYSRDELIDMGRYDDLFGLVDVLVSGRYIKELPNENSNSLLSSTNQEYILLSKRHPKEELFSLNSRVEVHFTEVDTVKVTGFPSKDLIKEMRKEFT